MRVVARGERGDDGEDGIFVDHRGARSGGTRTPLQPGVPHDEVGDRLAAVLALVVEGDVGAHLAQRVVEAGARRD